jgi:cbb3-type cytochrome oxidase subunit 3/transcriptional regulator of met regulon
MKLVSTKKLWTLASFGVVLVTIVLLASSLSQVQFKEGHLLIFGNSSDPTITSDGTPARDPIQQLGSFWGGALTIVFWVLVPLSILYILISKRARKRVLRDIFVVGSFLLILYFFIQAFRGNSPVADEANAPNPAQAESPETVVVPSNFPIDPPEWLTFAGSFILIVLIILLLAFLWFRMRPRVKIEEQSTLDLLVDEAQETLQDLRSGAGLKDVVIRCYQEMCTILAEQQGVRRRRAMTPREFQVHLAHIGVENEHIERLTSLFESVRYGPESSNQSAVKEAELCLETIVRSYERPA